ncbi:MAG: 3-isopropylmalate dehydratase small subunit [Phycisphaeraceae bacterium]|nr:3-isopropylmalate dehydratase small subunit [Phycisphaeraceae bacterium]
MTTELQRKQVTGTGIPVSGNDIDTDRIIPARFMKCVTFEGLEQYVFYDVRFDAQGQPKDHPYNEARYQHGSVLIVNKNFGCGSSREHAPQALIRFGMRAVIGESFAEIFAGNCTALGVPAVTASAEDIAALMQIVNETPSTSITIDLRSKTVTCGPLSATINIPESSRQSLVEGAWDTTSQLLDKDAIVEAAAKLPYLNW